jgi:hypothetical protein
MLARVLLWGFLSLIGLYSAVGVWAKNDSLEKAVRCDQFKPLPNGNWVAVQNISLAYRWRTIGNLGLGNYQWSFSKGKVITGNGGSEDARLFAALNKVCGKE